MILKLDVTNMDYKIPFNYIKISRCIYELESNSTFIAYECGNQDDDGKFIASRDEETIHVEPKTVDESFGKKSPGIDAYNILMARAGYKGKVT